MTLACSSWRAACVSKVRAVHDSLLLVGREGGGERFHPRPAGFDALLDEGAALRRESDDFVAPVDWVFAALQQAHAHQPVDHLARGGVADADVRSQIGDGACPAVMQPHQGIDLRGGKAVSRP